jgi:metallo-beta-lactamase family protein
MTRDSFGSANGPRVTFWGAAQAVTGSMHLVETAGLRLLLDCGLVLGWSAHAQERNRNFPFPPSTLSAVVLSHAHIDHCGNLPNLVRQGFDGPIFCTPATRSLLAVMLADSARIQEEEARVNEIVGRADESSTGLLYTSREVQRTLGQCVTVPYDEPVQIRPGLQARFVDAGHLLGSAMIALKVDAPAGESTITYTGDLGRPGLKFLRDPAPMPAADLIICESTYGGRTHQSLDELAHRLQEVVQTTIARGGKVLIPAFSLGRAQVVVHYVRQWMAQGKLPRVPIYMDSPLAADIAEIHKLYPESLVAVPSSSGSESGQERARSADDAAQVRYIRASKESRELSRRREACVLVASGGMCEAGRILNHLENNLDDPRNSVVLVSYQAPGSLGRKLLERGPVVHFRGRRWHKWAEIVDLNGFSGHADQEDLMNFFRPLIADRPRVRLVHGELEQAEALAQCLRAEGIEDVLIPRREESVRVA